MATNLIALFKIMSVSIFIYLYLLRAIKPITNSSDFNIWVISFLVLTAFAFLAPNVTIFFAISAAFLLYISRFINNKLSLFIILIFIVPGFIYQLPIINLTFQVLVGLILLMPVFLSNTFKRSSYEEFKKPLANYFFIGYLLLVFFLHFRGLFVNPDEAIQQTYSSCIKNGVNLFLQFYLPYYIASRYIKDFNQLKNVIIAFVTVCMFISPIALIELMQSSLLYSNIQNTLNVDWGLKSAVIRSNLVRASASIEHPLFLGTTMLIAMFLYLFVANYIKNKTLTLLGFMIIACGLVAPLSRGPWIGVMLSTLCYSLIGDRKLRNLVIIISFISLTTLVLSITDNLDKIIPFLPFIGNVDEGNVSYRAQLLITSLSLIEQNPFFGVYSPENHKSLQSLVQGEGIVDIVNVYLGVALNYGIASLILYLAYLFTVTFSLIKALILIKDKSSPEYLCGKSLLSTLLGLYLVMTVISNSVFFNIILFTLIGLTVSYVQIIKKTYIKPFEEYPISRTKN